MFLVGWKKQTKQHLTIIEVFITFKALITNSVNETMHNHRTWIILSDCFPIRVRGERSLES